jgi:hypothetical protein
LFTKKHLWASVQSGITATGAAVYRPQGYRSNLLPMEAVDGDCLHVCSEESPCERDHSHPSPWAHSLGCRRSEAWRRKSRSGGPRSRSEIWVPPYGTRFRRWAPRTGDSWGIIEQAQGVHDDRASRSRRLRRPLARGVVGVRAPFGWACGYLHSPRLNTEIFRRMCAENLRDAGFGPRGRHNTEDQVPSQY